jgi:hypothetical protein
VRGTVERLHRCASSIWPTEAIALALITLGASRIYHGRLDSRGFIALFAVAWTASAAKPLLQLRKGHYRPLQASAGNGNAFVLALVVGFGPWFTLKVLSATYASWPIWTPLGLPLWLKIAGALLALWAVAHRPRRASHNTTVITSSNPFVPDLTITSATLALALFLTSGSIPIAIVVASWLVTLAGMRLLVGLRRVGLTREVPTYGDPLVVNDVL